MTIPPAKPAAQDRSHGNPPAPAWPPLGGICGALVRAMDWSDNPLGPVDGWSPALRHTVANVVNSPVAKVLMWGPAHVMVYNDAYIEIAGARHPQALGGTVDGIWPEIWQWNEAMLAAGMRGEIQHFRDRVLPLTRDGVAEEHSLDLFYTPVYEVDGSVGGVMCTAVDNTKRVIAERALARRELQLRTITDALPMLIGFIDRDLVFRFANQHYVDWFNLTPAQVVGRHARDVIGPDNFAARRGMMERALAGEALDSDAVLLDGHGNPRRANVRYTPRVESDGSVSGFQVLVFDVEERAAREEALLASNRRFRAAMDAIHGVLWTNDAQGRMVGEQPGWAALTGQREAEYQGYGWSSAVHPDDAAKSIAAWERAVATKSLFVDEQRVRGRDGWRTFTVRAVPVLNEVGEIGEWVGVHTDITHQRAAEQALRERATDLEREVRHRERAQSQLRDLNETLEARVVSEIAERRQAEARLVQAQKMEVVGQLTGGVAHDFNNLLQVIAGNLQLLEKDVADQPRAMKRVTNAMAGVTRGARLASQLLAFGRRQALEPRVLNIARLVRGMDDMLARAIGEGVEVETITSGGLWNTFIDPAQIENAILNLAINARDAMDGSGKLTIELGNASLDDAYADRHDDVAAGQYVMLAVTDTGSGMTPAVIERAFEPFYSTKGEGKGSGLGLSMVYGFVKQSGGHVKIYSEPGEGTTIRLYLPRSVEREAHEVMPDLRPVEGGTETVLVVEDDAEVRATVVELLTDLGYRVLKAVDAQSALHVVESGVQIDLLFTDVVMPGTLRSPDLARMARERLPGIAVLFTSGYTENSIVHGGKLDPGVDLLSKPYGRDALARKVRHVLANQAQRNVARARLAEAAMQPVPLAPARPLTVLVVEDDLLILMNAVDVLAEAGHGVFEAPDGDTALTLLAENAIDVLVTDYNLPDMTGADLAVRARERQPDLVVIFATGDPQVAARAAIPGARSLVKPYAADDLLACLGPG